MASMAWQVYTFDLDDKMQIYKYDVVRFGCQNAICDWNTAEDWSTVYSCSSRMWSLPQWVRKPGHFSLVTATEHVLCPVIEQTIQSFNQRWKRVYLNRLHSQYFTLHCKFNSSEYCILQQNLYLFVLMLSQHGSFEKNYIYFLARYMLIFTAIEGINCWTWT